MLFLSFSGILSRPGKQDPASKTEHIPFPLPIEST
jgi:hypothetical protein